MRIALVLCAVSALAAGPLAGRQPTVRLTDNHIQMLSPWDVANPTVGNLNPALLAAVQRAATAAAAEGITMTITSGWRAPEFQQQLLDDAIAAYGSFGAARQYVQTPEHSKHVLGQAVDIGGGAADYWLIANGARFGLCQIYANEPWHFELAADAMGNCPPLLATAAG
jgi:D-alanyl-D-alanine carboxypeptidase